MPILEGIEVEDSALDSEDYEVIEVAEEEVIEVYEDSDTGLDSDGVESEEGQFDDSD